MMNPWPGDCAVGCRHCWHSQPRSDCKKGGVANYETRCCKCNEVKGDFNPYVFPQITWERR